MQIRLQKAIADAGICSRRKAEELISMGLVRVNGVIAKLGCKIDQEVDEIEVESKKLKVKSRKLLIYIILNKPVGYISSTTSSQGKSVLDLVTSQNCVNPDKYDSTLNNLNSIRLFPVGRLDKDSEGLVLLTNDGELTDKLTHPKYEHKKEYEITISESLSDTARKKLEQGMSFGDTNVKGIEIKKTLMKGRKQVVTIVLKEGKNRQIRKMFGRLGYDLLSLRRIGLGKLELKNLPLGKWKFVQKKDII